MLSVVRYGAFRLNSGAAIFRRCPKTHYFVVINAAYSSRSAGRGCEQDALHHGTVTSPWGVALCLALVLSQILRQEGNGRAECNEEAVYTRAEIEKHTTRDKGVWVTYAENVYDITNFLPNHPGGQSKIMLAAGKDIGPYWKQYPQHFNSKFPAEVLEKMRIGTLHPDDCEKEASDEAKREAEREAKGEVDDPFINEPELKPLLKYHMEAPVNAEPPEARLTENWITPNNLWFVRNHHPMPIIQESQYLLTISGLGLPHGHVDRAISFSLSDLQTKFNKKKVISSLQCGGNRRAEMNNVKTTFGTPWKVSAISTAEWGGVLLSDLLRSVGVDIYSACRDGIEHIQFVGAEGLEASIPVNKALDIHGDVLIAYEMNGEPIPIQHGYPVRVIVPGHVGVRNVKWLSKICLSSEESHGPWQRGMSYKGFGPSTTSVDGIDVEKIPSLQEQPVQSAITVPSPSWTMTDEPHGNREGRVMLGTDKTATKFKAGGKHTVEGYAYSGGGRGIVRVDVSSDGGKTWVTADLQEGSHQHPLKSWAWTIWRCEVEVPESMAGKSIELICKATDNSYNVQPDSLEGIWNLRGINNNAWHRVVVDVE